ncbi:hypothetical protein KFL_007030040 [Klebsormidium nitens]|uniref:Uncharacterized protein n=1 Tax=Klebsormidium nitens TaxID=105231 RepID=A0A1Y1IP28_KLENI|nr:hypothetical protein KFL_007030040 [Klebsormidium nitens]|eukprot:GAQ90931.1 hypothetical protein KFL_007030040 [Klebsormidium nitens]
MLSSLLEGEYKTNYPPRRLPQSETKSFAELANDRGYTLPEKAATSGRDSDSCPAGRPSGSRVIGPCSSFFEQRWNLAADNGSSTSQSNSETSDRYKDPGVVYQRQPMPSKTHSNVPRETYPAQYTTSKQADFEPTPRGNPRDYQARSLKPGRSELALGTISPQFRTTSQAFQSDVTAATARVRAQPKAGAKTSQLPTHNIITGGQPLSNTTHDAFDPKRSYGKYGTLEREKGASAAECFREFTRTP